ncbi:MAG TPA: tetratricopeptide repeat protein [Candidatus Binataceae bacterium]|nr:tetratricopeptide repeat protein [Candidatus Binataceae bacterium]
MATRHKISRKELKQPDEFQSIFETAGLFFELHMTEVLLGAAALVVIVAIALGFYYYAARRGREAAARFDQALSELQGGKYDAAETALLSLAADEPHRAVGRLANLYLATAYLAQKEPAKARDALLRYLAEDDASLFRGAALDDLAVSYEDLGGYQQAEDTYRQASKIEGPEQARAELGMARMLQKQGKRAAAISAYNDFLAQHPYAPERTVVMETLAQLGVAPTAEPAPPIVNVVKPAGAP